MQDYRKLVVWQKAHSLAVDIHRASRSWSPRESAGLSSQARRAAESIPANIAEGCGRDGGRDLARFLQIAAGSASELEYHLQFAAETGIMAAEKSRLHQERVVEIRRMLGGLIRKVRNGNSEY